MKSTLLIAALLTLLCSTTQASERQVNLIQTEYRQPHHYRHLSRAELEMARNREMLISYQIAENRARAHGNWHEVRQLQRMRFELQRKIAHDARKTHYADRRYGHGWREEPYYHRYSR